MLDYDKKMAEKKANEKAMEEEAEDNDGWVTVSARKKRGEYALSRKESTINKVQHKEEQKNKKKQLLNFYTFQIRESKKQSKFYFMVFSLHRNQSFKVYYIFVCRSGRVKEKVRIR